MTEEKVAEKPGPSRKAIIGWTAGMLAVVGLAVGGGMAYRPLRLRYAIYRARRTRYRSYDGPDKWLRICVEGARQGNPAAVETVVDVSVRALRHGVHPRWREVVFGVAAARPQQFFGALAEHGDGDILPVLEGLHLYCSNWLYVSMLDLQGKLWSGMSEEVIRNRIKLVAKDFTCLQLPKKDGRRVARAALEFMRGRFPEELAEAERERPPPRP